MLSNIPPHLLKGATVCSSVPSLMCWYKACKLLMPAKRTDSPVRATLPAVLAASSLAAAAIGRAGAAAGVVAATAVDAAVDKPPGNLVSAMKPAMAPMLG